MANFLLVPHHGRERAVDIARQAIDWLTERGHGAYVLENDAVATGLTQWAIPDLTSTELDLTVSIGGDGTMLRALELVCHLCVPVLGVNVGHLGYLTEVEPEHLEEALVRFLAGDYSVEERVALDVSVTTAARTDPTRTTLALSNNSAVNDVVVEKTASGQTVRLEVFIEGKPFLTYAVDGMIVATPTGSTAYNLSARGPILSPTLNAILMTPVSAHMLFDRAMVLDGGEALDLHVIGRETAAVVVDGRHVATLGPGGVVSCRQAETPARILVLKGRDFRQILKTKFRLVDR